MNFEADATFDMVTRNWWLLALRGLAAVIFGVLAFVWPGITLLTLVYVFGAYVLLYGVLSLVLAAKAPKGFPLVAWIFSGLFSLAAGVISFVLPGITAIVLLIIIAWWAIANGIMEIVAAVRLRKAMAHEWLLVLAGLCSIAFGILLLVWPGAGALALLWWIASFAIVFGFLMIVLAFRLRHGGGVAPSHPVAAT